MHSAAPVFANTTRSRVSPLALFCLVLALATAAPAQTAPAEQQNSAPQTTEQPKPQPFPADTIKADGVRAGAMSGGFFHASIAALALNDPKLLASRIERSGDDYLVNFADGKLPQRVTAAEVETVRSSGFDRSDDPWVAALYRAYEMRVLYEVIHFSVGRLNFSPGIKAKTIEMMDKNEWLVKAYERAIRAKVTPTGDLNEAALREGVRDQLKSTQQDADARKSAENMLVSMDMFKDVSATVKENGELFGAYKAPANATLPDRIVEAFAGKARVVDKPALRVVNATLKEVRENKRAAVVSTADLPLNKLKSRPASPLPWYAPLHAYTLVDSTATTVTLRNPCADQGKATFKVPAASVPSLFPHVTVQE